VVKGTFGKNQALFNNAAQRYNHIHFWQWMKKGGGGDKLPGKLEKPITTDIGPIAKMKEDFVQAGMTQFGSGWCWLAVKDGKITVMKTPNGENPLVHGAKPILGCDVWEHSYYIDYRNRRQDYLKAFLVIWSIGITSPRSTKRHEKQAGRRIRLTIQQRTRALLVATAAT
jgi:Fe-Mn family superoxide dismutase